jgi:hypothetical protein
LDGHFEKTAQPFSPEDRDQVLRPLLEKLLCAWTRGYRASVPLPAFGDEDFSVRWDALLDGRTDLEISPMETRFVADCVHCVLAELKGNKIELETVLDCTQDELEALDRSFMDAG